MKRRKKKENKGLTLCRTSTGKNVTLRHALRSTINLRRLWTSAFFRLASGTVGFSPRLKNSGHVITFLRRCGLQNTDHVMPFWLGQPVSFSHLCQSPEEGKMSFAQFYKIFYGDNFERCKMHRMKKERFQLITYQETID